MLLLTVMACKKSSPEPSLASQGFEENIRKVTITWSGTSGYVYMPEYGSAGNCKFNGSKVLYWKQFELFEINCISCSANTAIHFEVTCNGSTLYTADKQRHEVSVQIP